MEHAKTNNVHTDMLQKNVKMKYLKRVTIICNIVKNESVLVNGKMLFLTMEKYYEMDFEPCFLCIEGVLHPWPILRLLRYVSCR